MAGDITKYISETVALDPTLKYGQGRCFATFALLRARYGVKAQAYYDGNHVTTKIDGQHYDARGKVKPEPQAIKLTDKRTISQLRRHAERGGWHE